MPVLALARISVFIGAICGSLLRLAAPVWAAEPAAEFTRDIRPILKERCYACHGALKQESILRVDTAASLLRGGESGPAVVPGKSDKSRLIEAVTGDLAVWRMPPEGEALTARQIELLRRWIDSGAPLPEHEEPEPDPKAHWAFQIASRPSVPAVRSAAWVRNPIDAFLAAEHERLGLTPAAPAPHHVLLRRVYLDLIGLPPTREQAQTFLADPSEDAWRRVVQELLDSPEHGQRWARHWMDVWRYSDWSGEGQNLVRGSPKHIWRWRDWIVDSLNEDKPYDRMIVEMLAGDEVAPADPNVLRATGFLARNWYQYNRNIWLDDTVEHTAKAFLGLTLSCARCHDHKFDPLSQREYYAWRAIFEPHDLRIDPVPGQPDTEKDGLPRVYDAQAGTPTYVFIRGEESRPDKKHSVEPAVLAALGGQFEIEPVSLPLAVYYPAVLPEASAELVRRAEAELAAAQDAAASAKEQDNALAQARLAAAETDLASLQARIAAEQVKYARELESRLQPAEAGTPTYDELAAAAAAADRLAVLRKAELAVLRNANKTGSDARAAQKELTSAQAAMKKTDATYRPLGPQTPQTSTGRRSALARWIADPRNPLTARVAVNHVWLRHFGQPLVDEVDDFGRRTARPRQAALLDWLAVELVENGWSLKHLHRLIVTSNAFRMASSLREAPQGNLRLDAENRWLWRMNSRRAEAEVIRDSVLHVAGNLDCSLSGPEIPLDQGEKSLRRSLYFRHAFERQVPFLKAFDGADAMECYRRSITVLPQQALALINSTLPYEQSRLLAQRLSKENEAVTDAAFVRLAFEHVLTRPPTPAEQDECLGFLKVQGPAEARAALVHVLMNHNDFITIR